ncbi:DUF4249 domain-containing protein [Flagellimonas algicola]|nr:DUF4249 domain-containing protein [Allomuricauda algicola]
MLPNYGCIEEFNAEFIDFESTLVIEATITDEFKPQEVLLSRTYRIQDEEIEMESGATVSVISSDGQEFPFQEQDQGTYVSNTSFAALPQLTYQLAVETQDGKSYSSTAMGLPEVAKLDSVYAKRFTNDLGEDGMGIFVNASVAAGTASGFYRYEYEETYKIIAPFWDPVELEVVESTPPNIIKVPRSLDERICYATFDSNRIILADTEDLDGDNAENILVRFIPSNDYIISHRYSILVRQYSLSIQAHAFFETLNEFSTNESLFSESQPGFLEGNVFSENSSNEKVLGYFDVVNVDEKRIFFNYSDFYPMEDLPPYVDPCQFNTPTIGLIDLVRWDWVKYIDDNYIGSGLGSGPYITVPQVCGDCTVLGTSEVPDFWIE